ncbi:hypothetical protein LZC95_05395 [Pendulispora brunnea]|uniref:Homeodomain transcription factor HD2 n=1 Tax=Pendulispora brunnea TaxID=2905690 RepID=A0ABZ2KC82_9BACT
MQCTNRRPTESLPVIALLVEEGLAHAREQLGLLAGASAKGDAVEAATLDRFSRFFADELGVQTIYEGYVVRWSREPANAHEQRELTRLRQVLAHTRATLAEGEWMIGTLKEHMARRKAVAPRSL